MHYVTSVLPKRFHIEVLLLQKVLRLSSKFTSQRSRHARQQDKVKLGDKEWGPLLEAGVGQRLFEPN